MTRPEDAALRLARALGLEYDDLDLVMRIINRRQEKTEMCVVVENFDAAVSLEIRKAKNIEGTMRSHAQGHRNAGWLFMGTRAILPAFVDRYRPFFMSGLVLFEEKIRPG